MFLFQAFSSLLTIVLGPLVNVLQQIIGLVLTSAGAGA